MRNKLNKNYELIIQKNSFVLIILALDIEKFISIVVKFNEQFRVLVDSSNKPLNY